MGNLTRYLPKLALATGSIALVVSLAESGLRLGSRLGSPPSLVEDPFLGWDSLPSGSPVGDEPGGDLVLFLGDSFTQNNRWPDQVARHLGLPGINAGVSGFGTCQQLLKLSQVLKMEKPCLVVLQFYAWNDLRDNWAWPALGYSPEMLTRPYLSPYGNWFHSHYPWQWMDTFKVTSYFGKRSLVRAWQKADRVMRSEGLDILAAGRQMQVAGLCAEEAWQPFYRPDQQSGAYVQGAWQVTETCFLKIRELCQERQIPLLILALDAPFTVDQDKWLALSQAPIPITRDLPLDRLRRFFFKENIHAVLPQAKLRDWNVSTGRPAYDGEAQSLIGHLTLEAQEIVAREVALAAGKLMGKN